MYAPSNSFRTLSCVYYLCPVLIAGVLQPIVSPYAGEHHKPLIEGIDSMCPDRRSSNILVLYFDDLAAWHASFSGLTRWIPVTVQNVNLPKHPYWVYWGSNCVIGFFNDTDVLQRSHRHIPIAKPMALIFPDSELNSFLEHASSMSFKLVYLFPYNANTLNGSWIIYQHTNVTWTLESFRHFSKDMRGYLIRYQNSDIVRETTYDVAIGQTIARRHNATFTAVIEFNSASSIDYESNTMFSGEGHYIPLPEMNEMCFSVPKSAPKSVFRVLLDPYDKFSWIAFGLTIVIISLVLTKYSESLGHFNVIFIALEMLMIVLNGPTHKLHGRFDRFVVGLFMLLSIVLVSGYQSLVISFMSMARYEPDLDTIELINDTCLFLYSIYLSNLGYKFKNTYQGLDMFDSVEHMWQLKHCMLVTCTDAQYVMTHIGTVDKPIERDPDEFLFYSDIEWVEMKRALHYFRYSKARIHSTTGLYRAAYASPVRHALEHYTQAFVEGKLHYFPMLLAGNPIPRSILEEKLETIEVQHMAMKDLQVVWLIYTMGLLLSVVSFAVEVGVLLVNKIKNRLSERWGRRKRKCTLL